MGKTKPENPIRVSIPESQSIKFSLLKDIFFSPPSAFETLLKSNEVGKKELRSLHFSLIIWAPIFKLLGNFIQFGLKKWSEPEEEVTLSLFGGVLSVFAFYFVVLILLRFLDIFRLYHLDRDRELEWLGPPAHIFSVSFLPFSATGVFWILPQPLPIFLLFFSFFYSLNIAFVALQVNSKWTSNQFFFFLLKFFLFLSLISFVPLLAFNLYRTVFL